MGATNSKARLFSAYSWDCDNCGAENFERAVTADLTDDEREEAFRHFHDLEPWTPLPEGWREFELVTSPTVVTCRSCGMEFEAEDDR